MKRNLHAGRKPGRGFFLEIFSDDDLYDIHAGTLEVLEQTGVFVEDEEALAVFDGGGAKVDKKKKIVKIPPHIVEEAINSAPSDLMLAGRNPKNDTLVGGRRVNFVTFGEAIQVVDPDTGNIRPSTKADVGTAGLVADHLSEVDIYLRSVGAHDVPEEVAPIHNAEAALLNTSKHVILCPGNVVLTRKIIELAAAVAGGKDKLKNRPILSFITATVSPLKLIKDACQIIMESARSGMVCCIGCQALAGGSAPVTLPGTLITQNSEILSAIVLSQLTQKGAKVIYLSSTCPLDLKLGTASVGAPEVGMISAATAQLCIYYLLPSWVAGG